MRVFLVYVACVRVHVFINYDERVQFIYLFFFSRYYFFAENETGAAAAFGTLGRGGPRASQVPLSIGCLRGVNTKINKLEHQLLNNNWYVSDVVGGQDLK